MTLSDFIASNTESSPSPQKEWEVCKLLLKTLADSNVLELLSQLANSIRSNVAFEHKGVGTSQALFVFNVFAVSNELKRNAQQLVQMPKVLEPPGSGSIPGVPCARVELQYNPRQMLDAVEPPTRLWQAPYRRIYTEYDRIWIDCAVPGQVRLDYQQSTNFLKSYMLGNAMYFYKAQVLEEDQWKQPGVLDKALGDLYSRGPAKRKGS